MSRRYITLDHQAGYPAGKTLFYECLKCGDVVPSEPATNTSCRCYNICIDQEYGRLILRDKPNVKAFLEEL